MGEIRLGLAGRMVVASAGLFGLLVGVGFVAVIVFDFPVWPPFVSAVVVVTAQYALGPAIIEWLIPAEVIPHDGESYATDERLGALVERRCRDAGLPPVRLGVIEDGTPNAFTFGHTPRSARVWVSRGLLDRLDERELDAVVCHELGHVKHWDMAVMTAVAVVPMLLYLLYLMAGNRGETQPVAFAVFLAYLVAQLNVLTVSRVRELAADRWSCACTGDGDALASALVKIAYGIGRQHQDEAHQVDEQEGENWEERWKRFARKARLKSTRMMGIMGEADGHRAASLLTDDQDFDAARAALRWDRTSPWARFTEKLSTHPMVATRIAALGRSGLPGAPTGWMTVSDHEAVGAQEQVKRARRRLPTQILAAAGLPVTAFGFLIAWRVFGNLNWVGWTLVAGGAVLFVQARLRYPFGHRPVERVTSLLERLDASPVAGIPVEVRGRIVGRATPGYVLSPSLVMADDSGFVPLLYTNPLPFAAERFALMRVEDFLEREVMAQGWYFRGAHGPMIVLRNVQTEDESEPEATPNAEADSGLSTPTKTRPTSARTWGWIGSHIFAAVVFAAGIVVVTAFV